MEKEPNPNFAKISRALDEDHGNLTQTRAAELLGVKIHIVEKLRKNGAIGAGRQIGPRRGTGGSSTTASRPRMEYSGMLRLAYAMYLKKTGKKKTWSGACSAVNSVGVDREERRKFLKTDYWQEIVEKAKEKGVVLEKYPHMDPEVAKK